MSCADGVKRAACAVLVLSAILLWAGSGDALAAEEISGGRKLYDTIMMWVNFGILVFFFMKYGKPALMNFLTGERNRIQKTLHEIEKDVNLSKMRMEEESKKLENIDDYIQQIRADILEMGRMEKERIVQDARQSAEQMIENAGKEFAVKLEGATRTLNDGLVDQAVEQAGEKLRKAFSDQDNEKQITGFIDRLGGVESEDDLRL
ncbi:MAG: ATP synthase F0 subunit B [Deltaproteobacteria bacterium]|nr:ATP synthase F0 subunit B [Deltaproteobacteria bacterium]